MGSFLMLGLVQRSPRVYYRSHSALRPNHIRTILSETNRELKGEGRLSYMLSHRPRLHSSVNAFRLLTAAGLYCELSFLQPVLNQLAEVFR